MEGKDVYSAVKKMFRGQWSVKNVMLSSGASKDLSLINFPEKDATVNGASYCNISPYLLNDPYTHTHTDARTRTHTHTHTHTHIYIYIFMYH